MADPLTQFPTVIANGDTPDADVVMADFQHIRTYLNNRLGTATDHQILVADNATGRFRPRTMSGDATINETGVVSVGLDDGAIPDEWLESSTAGVYKLIHHQVCMIGFGTPPGLYVPVPGTSLVADPLTTDNTDEMPDWFRYSAADYNVPAMPEKLLIRAQLANNRNPDVDVTVRLYPFAVTGPSDSDIRFNLTDGSPVTGSTTAIAAAGEGMRTANSGDFDPPDDDEYMFGVSIGAGTMATNYRGVLAMSVYVHSV